MAEPFFTIYVPFHSEAYADAAKRALDSLEAQFFQSFEVIVVVNGTHIPHWCATTTFLNDTRAAFGRYVLAGRYHTLTSAANAAMDIAAGRWFMRLDADDVMKPDALAEYARAISRAQTERGAADDFFVVAGHWDETDELYGSGLAIPTDWLRRIGGYDEDRPLGDGRYILERIRETMTGKEPKRIYRTGYPVYAYQRHLSSMSQPPEDAQ